METITLTTNDQRRARILGRLDEAISDEPKRP